ncbi:MAG: hypothetical protein KDD64_02595 [Bdellovibrionales bacterium]|nr:hypothetical protein [Bdellovibrionales bacterium]
MEFDNKLGKAPNLENGLSDLSGSLPAVGRDIAPHVRGEVVPGVRSFQSEPELGASSGPEQAQAPLTIRIGNITLTSSAPSAEVDFTGRDAGSTGASSTPFSFQSAPEALAEAGLSAEDASPSIRFPGGLVVGASNEMAERILAA